MAIDGASVRIDDRWAIVNPIPRPCAFVVTNGVNNAPSTCVGKPVPLSRTVTSTSVAPTSVLMEKRRRPGGESAIASMAFITRFTSTCCKST